MSQRYSSEVARSRMSNKRCPECGAPPVTHSNDNRFWIPRACDLTVDGVIGRIDQYAHDEHLGSK